MEPKEIEKIKKAVAYLKIARKSDYVTFHAMVDGEIFNEEVIEPLEKITQWSREDDKSVNELAEKFKKETEGKTLKEKSDKLKNLLKIGGGIGLASVMISGIGFAAYQMIKKGAKE